MRESRQNFANAACYSTNFKDLDFFDIFRPPLYSTPREKRNAEMLKNSVKILLLVLATLTTGTSKSFSHECETSCSSSCTDFINEMQRIIYMNQAYCGSPPPAPSPSLSCQDQVSVVHSEYSPRDLDYVYPPENS